MHSSCHAQKRMKQRGIRRGEAEFVLDHGRAEQVPGGAERLVILRKELHQWIAFHLDEARRLMRMRKVGVVASGGVVVTVQHRFKAP